MSFQIQKHPVVGYIAGTLTWIGWSTEMTDNSFLYVALFKASSLDFIQGEKILFLCKFYIVMLILYFSGVNLGGKGLKRGQPLERGGASSPSL